MQVMSLGLGLPPENYFVVQYTWYLYMMCFRRVGDGFAYLFFWRSIQEKKAAETAREKELEDSKDEKRRLMESQRYCMGSKLFLGGAGGVPSKSYKSRCTFVAC